MESELLEIRDAQKASWDKFSPGWKKWDNLSMKFLEPYGNKLIQELKPKGTDLVLDIAAGTGEPGLSIAPLIPEGQVIITDLSEGMLKVAKEKAEDRGISNLETMLADACELPFRDNTFDAISCRFGFMFFPDMLLAAREMKRVLKPGGRLATSVWGLPENNFWVTCIVQNIKKHIDMPTPPKGAPSMFRCSEPGFMAQLFRIIGLKNVSEKEAPGTIHCDSAEQYWDFMTEIAAPFAAALSNADAETVKQIKQDVIAAVNEKYPAQTSLDTNAIIIYGEK